MTRVPRSRDGGFLLVETLATFTISAFVLLGLVSAASVLLRSVDRSVARVESTDDLGRALAALSHEMTGVKRARWNGLEPQPFVFRGGRNSLFFARAVRNPDGTSATRVVALREIVDGASTRLMRAEARLSARATSLDDLEYGPQREIWTGPARLRFAYVPQRQNHDEPPPRQDWPVGAQMPAAVLIQAIDRDTRRVLLTERVTIAADTDIGCLEADAAAGDAGTPAGTEAVASAANTPTGTGGVDFGAIPPQQALPDPMAPASATAQTSPDDSFCGRLEDDKRKASGAPSPPPGEPPPGAPGPTP